MSKMGVEVWVTTKDGQQQSTQITLNEFEKEEDLDELQPSKEWAESQTWQKEITPVNEFRISEVPFEGKKITDEDDVGERLIGATVNVLYDDELWEGRVTEYDDDLDTYCV